MASVFKDIWKRSKDGSKREQRSFIRFSIIAFAFAVLLLFARRDNVVRWIQAGFTIDRQEREIERYRKEIEEMEGRIEDLRTNRDSLEKYAREEFNFARKGDDVYIVR